MTDHLESFDLAAENTIICDIDEVVLHFLQPFRKFLASRGYFLRSADYSLNNNVIVQKTNTLADIDRVKSLISEFYSSTAANFPAVEEAQSTLLKLSKAAQIILLTNIPAEFYDQRKQNLDKLGFRFPLIVNSGPKGPIVAKLAGKTENHVFFLDDSPINLTSAIEHHAEIHLIHFIADSTFFELAPDVNGVKLKTRSWSEVANYIGGHL